jgi:glucokinase
MHTIDPDVVLFGGGMIAAGPALLEAIREDVRALAFPVPASETRVAFAELGGDAGFIGAAGCARQVFGEAP